MKKILASVLVLAVLGVAGVAWASQSAADASEDATLQQAPEQAPPVAAPAATACASSILPQAPLLAQVVTGQSCDPPAECVSRGTEVQYCECLQHHNALCCYKEWCSEELDCPDA